MHLATVHPQTFAPARPGSSLLRRLEALAMVYVILISSGALGFVDVMAFGDTYIKTSESLLARLVWPIAYLAFVGLIVWQRRAVLASLRRCWWILPYPLIAFTSALWSLDPAVSLNGAIRLVMTTLIAFHLGSRFDLFEIARAVFFAMLAAVILSILAGLAGQAFATMFDGSLRGLFHHKNVLGSRAALLFATSLALMLAGWRVWPTSLALVVAAAAVVLSKSATSLAVVGLCLLVVPFSGALRGRGALVVSLVALLGAAIAAVAFFLVAYRIDPVREVLGALGRDLTLTGRMMIWQAAFDYIGERPLLGTGFDAFWAAGVDWQMLQILDRLGSILHFHNSFLEVGVQLGTLGLIGVGLLVIAYIRATFAALRLRIDPLAYWPALFGTVAFGVAMAETELFAQHKVLQILLVAIIVAAFRQVERAQSAARSPSNHRSLGVSSR